VARPPPSEAPNPSLPLWTEVGTAYLYFSDGTAANTKSIRANSHTIFGSVGGYAYFTTRDQGGIWYTDGTRLGTKKVAGTDINTQSPSIILPYRSQTLIVKLPQAGFSDGFHYELFLHDRINNKLRKLAPVIFSKAGIARIAVLGNTLIYANEDAAHGAELWVSDGTAAGTKLLKDIFKGRIGSFDVRWSPYFDGPLAFRGKAYFLANDGIHGAELWATDGTPAGTNLLKDIVPGVGGITDDVEFNDNVGHLNTASPFIVFSVRGGSLWRSDGTPAGTKSFVFRDGAGKSIIPSQGLRASTGNARGFLFEGRPAGSVKSALYIGDVIAGTARLVRDLNKTPDCPTPGGPGIEYDFIYSFTPYAGKKFFSGADKITIPSCANRFANSELWVTDGTTAGTRRIREIYPGVGGSIDALFHYRGSDPQLLTVGGAAANSSPVPAQPH
jgi:ELWxxDGT repeat protein